MRDKLGSTLFWLSVAVLGGSLSVTGFEGNETVNGLMSGFWSNLEGKHVFGVPLSWVGIGLAITILARAAFPELSRTLLGHAIQAPGNLIVGAWRALSLGTKFVVCGGDVVIARFQRINGAIADSALSRALLSSNCLDSGLARREFGEAQSALAQMWEQYHSEEADASRTPMQRTAASPQVQGVLAYLAPIAIAAVMFWVGYNWATGTTLPDAIAKLRPATAAAATAKVETPEAPKTENATPASAPATTTEAKAAPVQQQAPVVEAVSTSASAPSKI